jgi:predicted acyltransferase
LRLVCTGPFTCQPLPLAFGNESLRFRKDDVSAFDSWRRKIPPLGFAIAGFNSLYADSTVQTRIRAIDALRGVSLLVWLVAAIFVPVLNELPRSRTVEALIKQCSPSFWAGITVYDLLLPMFLFVAGASIVPAFQKRREAGQNNRQLIWRIVRRVAVLVPIGIVCEGGLVQKWPYLRFVGTFQRIAICYAVVAIIELKTRWRFQLWLVVLLVVSYWLVLTFASMAGHPYLIENNAAEYVDNLLLPGRKCFGNWDAQGILTTIPAVAIMTAGLLAGRALSMRSPHRDLLLLAISIVAITEGFLWDFACPINSHLWTPTFCVVAIGIGLGLIDLLYTVLDVRGLIRCPTVITALGRNSLVTIVATVSLSTAISAVNFVASTHRFDAGAASPAWAVVEFYLVSCLALALDRRELSITA